MNAVPESTESSIITSASLTPLPRTPGMATYVLAFVMAALTAGFASFASHRVTLIVPAVLAIALAGGAALQPRSRIHPLWLILPYTLLTLVLLIADRHGTGQSPLFHNLAMFTALTGMAISCPDLSKVYRPYILMTFCMITGFTLFQAVRVGAFNAWSINGAASSGNLIAAQTNMILPFLVLGYLNSKGAKRFAYTGLILAGVTSVLLIMSRNGVGSFVIMVMLFMLFHRKKTALILFGGMSVFMVYSNEILGLPIIRGLLERYRLVGFQAQNSRTLIWRISWESLREQPIWGVGPGGSDRVLEILDVTHAHNNVVQSSLELGIFGGCLVFLMMLGLMSYPLKSLFLNKTAFLMSLSLLAYVLFSLTSSPIQHPQATLLLVACLNEVRVALRGADAIDLAHSVSERPGNISVPSLSPVLRSARSHSSVTS